MNKELILKVADEIEAMPHAEMDDDARFASAGFNMEVWGDEAADCGTVCCIGGHVAPDGKTYEVAERLGIPYDDAHFLCYPPLPYQDWHRVTPSQAARVLRHFAETGKVDWSVAVSEPSDA